MTGPAHGPGRTELRGKELALVVSTPPERGDLDRALALARAARRRGAEVGIFVMDAAVAGLPGRAAAVAALAADGAEIVACASSAERFAADLSELDSIGADSAEEDIVLGSQDDHAALVHRADRVVAFT